MNTKNLNTGSLANSVAKVEVVGGIELPSRVDVNSLPATVETLPVEVSLFYDGEYHYFNNTFTIPSNVDDIYVRVILAKYGWDCLQSFFHGDFLNNKAFTILITWIKVGVAHNVLSRLNMIHVIDTNVYNYIYGTGISTDYTITTN